MVNIVEVLSDPRFWALALDVCSGTSRGGVAGRRTAQHGQSSVAQKGHTAEDKHGELASIQCGCHPSTDREI